MKTPKIFKPGAPDPASPYKDLQAEVGRRLMEARQQKQFVQSDIEECYFFAKPRGIRSVSSFTNSNTPPGDQDLLQTSLGFEAADDHMTMIIASFMPQTAKWAERLAPPFVSKTVKEVIEKQAKEQDEGIFQMIRASNFYAELAKQGTPDGAIGVYAMVIESVRADRPVRCIGIPIRELEMNIGPDGRLDDRFIVRNRKYSKLKAELPDLYDKIPQKFKDNVAKKPEQTCEVVRGYWRNWDKLDDDYWQHVVTLDGEVIHQAEIKGEGCCSISVGRFGSMPEFAWPDGPLVKSLPDLRQLDDTRGAFVENLDFTLRPPITYDADDVFNVENGIEPGMAYPRRAGMGKETIQKIYEPNPLESAIFETKELERRIKRLHYVDFPEQIGKTPPTAAQWLDEMVKAQERIGTPGYSFWREFPFEVFQRFRYLAEMRGDIKPIEYDGKRVSLQAYNPAQRAQENQEVLTATKLLQIIATAFPQLMQALINGQVTIANIQAKLGDKLVALNSEEQIKAGIAQIAQLAGVGNPPPGGFPAGAQA